MSAIIADTGKRAFSEMRAALDAAVVGLPNHQTVGEGRGIVICGGGLKYFPSTYVCVRALRHLGCTLPVEVWHLGEKEMSPVMRGVLEPLGVRVVDGLAMRERFPVRRLGGWELKCYAILHSAFAEVLLLDADNVAVVEPSFLFETAEYRQHGAIFWPDFGRLAPERSIWEITGIPYRDEPEFESGQIVVDKARCWRELNLAMHFNEHSDFYYRHVHGDKETFHLAWRKLERSYAMPVRGIHPLPHTMCQHDFEGRRIFQHRNMDKWRFQGGNARIGGFLLEKECFGWLEELARIWNPKPVGVRVFSPDGRKSVELAAAAEVTGLWFDYHRVGFDRRRLAFSNDGRVAEGARRCELVWDVRESNGRVWLEVSGEDGLTMRLARDTDGVWRGQWQIFEKMPVELTATGLKDAGA